jgi:hypothetical protein
MDTKQKRKNPLTTVAISQEYAQRLDDYLKGTGLSRKEFVELAFDYFERTGFDIRGEAMDLSPLEKLAERIEKTANRIEQVNDSKEAIKLLVQTIQEQQNMQKSLPSLELVAQTTEQRVQAENKQKEQAKEIEQLREENKALREWKEQARKELIRIRDEQKTFGKLKVNTEF